MCGLYKKEFFSIKGKVNSKFLKHTFDDGHVNCKFIWCILLELISQDNNMVIVFCGDSSVYDHPVLTRLDVGASP
jgi:hypothetical protein